MTYDGVPLEKLLQNDALKGKWGWNQLFTYARVIRYWGIWPPSKFFKASQEDQAFAIVTYETEMGMQAWDQHVANLEAKRVTDNFSSDN